LLPSIEDEQVSGDVIHKFDMVEVLEDFVEKYGVIVIPLVKVGEFKAVFHHHFDEKEIDQNHFAKGDCSIFTSGTFIRTYCRRSRYCSKRLQGVGPSCYSK
jgi:hypothetical protein